MVAFFLLFAVVAFAQTISIKEVSQIGSMDMKVFLSIWYFYVAKDIATLVNIFVFFSQF